VIKNTGKASTAIANFTYCVICFAPCAVFTAHIVGLNKSMRPTDSVFFNFAQYGATGLWPFSPGALTEYHSAATYLIDNYDQHSIELSCNAMIDRLRLIAAPDQHLPNQEWLSNAVLVTAVLGLLGIQSPPIVQDWYK
jgi:hypothetical protein